MNRSETVMLRGRRRTKVRRYDGARREAHRSEAVWWCWEVVRWCWTVKKIQPNSF